MDDNETECLDKDGTTISGYLTRPVKTGKSLGFRRKRFYKLDGALLSKHANKGSPAAVVFNVQGAEIREIGRLMFAISFKDTENVSCHDFEKNMMVLSARTEKECGVWVWALKAAAQRRLKQYYEVGRIIGEGGFAQVRIGRCLQTKEMRAIKTLKKDDTYEKLQGREIAIIKSTDHPNIVKTYDVFETKSEIHIVMEFMAGGMLYDAIEDGIRFTEADVVQFMKEILDGILYLHGKGIVHRDLKPENILCTSRTAPLHVKISDFGLSCITSVADLKANRVLMSTMIGTPEFIAPEIARQEQYTEKVDMWALGMLCYNVIAGALPFDETRDAVPQIRDGVKLTFQERVWKTYSSEARSFVRGLLCKEAQKRLSPLGCMVHPWLERNIGRTSVMVGVHGRVSHRISTVNFATREAQYRNRMLRASATKNTRNEAHCPLVTSGRKGWKTAFLAVSALNRFKWLVNPRKADDTRTLNMDDSLTFEEDMGDQDSDSDEGSLGSAKFSFLVKAMQGSAGQRKHPSLSSAKNKKDRNSKLPAVVEKCETSSSGSVSSSSGRDDRSDRGKSGTIREGFSGGKKSAKSKDRVEISGGISPLRKVSKKLSTAAESAGFLGPLRKLSRKILPGQKPKGEAVNEDDLETSLAALGVTQVDEGDLLLMEDGELSGTTESKFSKDRNSTQLGASAEMSPVTPGSLRYAQDGKGKKRGSPRSQSNADLQ